MEMFFYRKQWCLGGVGLGGVLAGRLKLTPSWVVRRSNKADTMSTEDTPRREAGGEVHMPSGPS